MRTTVAVRETHGAADVVAPPNSDMLRERLRDEEKRGAMSDSRLSFGDVAERA